ncbi:MAG TPA: arginine--tRNA ligase [Acidimicrobiia bacterium]|nr:arginine--tRNA ligase [Acidimicrobiia bacterium]
MQSLYSKIELAARKAVLEATGLDGDPVVRWSSKPEFGDFQINAAMGLAKKLGEKPHDIAKKILENLDLTGLSKKEAEIAGPGFINVFLSNEALGGYAQELLGDKNCGVSTSSDPQRIVVDYGGANIAKEMHVGHLRSTVIGDSINRVLMFLGHTTIKQDHLGDWGTQFGMLVEFLCVDGKIPEQLPDLSDLDGFYKQAQEKFKTDEEFATKARARVGLLQGGDADSLRAWKHINDETMKHLLAIYSRLGVLLNSDDARGESFYNDMLEGVCTDLKEKGIALDSEGALVVYKDGVLDRDGNPFGLIIRKSDGGYGYATTDIAALKFAAENDKADRVVYVVDARQAQHFQIVFDATKRTGWIDNTEPEHAMFGTILGSDGKPFKTRSGDVVKLSALLDEAIDRASNLIAEKSSGLEANEKLDLARMVGIGALKYGDLSNNRAKNYVFDWDRMVAMEGNTAPYLQYAIARINSLIRKSEIEKNDLAQTEFVVNSQFEKDLILEIGKFSETLEEVELTLEPHRLCSYLFELAQKFTSFYENCPVLKEENQQVRKSRLALSFLCARTLKQGLELLGIESPERM